MVSSQHMESPSPEELLRVHVAFAPFVLACAEALLCPLAILQVVEGHGETVRRILREEGIEAPPRPSEGSNESKGDQS